MPKPSSIRSAVSVEHRLVMVRHRARVAGFPPTKYGTFLSISSSMLTRQGPPTPTVYCTYIIKHRGPKKRAISAKIGGS